MDDPPPFKRSHILPKTPVEEDEEFDVLVVVLVWDVGLVVELDAVEVFAVVFVVVEVFVAIGDEEFPAV